MKALRPLLPIVMLLAASCGGGGGGGGSDSIAGAYIGDLLVLDDDCDLEIGDRFAIPAEINIAGEEAAVRLNGVDHLGTIDGDGTITATQSVTVPCANGDIAVGVSTVVFLEQDDSDLLLGGQLISILQSTCTDECQILFGGEFAKIS